LVTGNIRKYRTISEICWLILRKITLLKSNRLREMNS